MFVRECEHTRVHVYEHLCSHLCICVSMRVCISFRVCVNMRVCEHACGHMYV